MFNTLNLNKTYIQLCVARDSNVADDIKAYDGENTHLLNYYTLATDASDNLIYADVEQLADKVDSIEVEDIIAVHGSSNFETRCYSRQAQVLILEDASVWLDAEMEVALFC
ncbi:MAG: hypothetical protein WCH33_09455 [Betaproteobacteria bacterium]|jgi:hypothetical protein